MRTVRPFFERIIEWDWPGTPARNPVIAWDIPKKPEPLPKFLDDRDAAKLMAAARASTDPRDRLVVELLARTGMRAGELADLDADAVVLIGAGHWLRIPLGKLRNDRYVPLHPELVSLLAAWTAANLDHIRRHRRLIADHRGPLDRHLIGRIVHRVGRAAGVPGVHPHRLRHTLATQAINRGMRLEAIAALHQGGGHPEPLVLLHLPPPLDGLAYFRGNARWSGGFEVGSALGAGPVVSQVITHGDDRSEMIIHLPRCKRQIIPVDHLVGGNRLHVVLRPGFPRGPSPARVEVAVEDFSARGAEPRDQLLLESVAKRLVS